MTANRAHDGDPRVAAAPPAAPARGRAVFALALLAARLLPRGKDWTPRWIGRTLGAGMVCGLRTRHGAWLAVDPENLDLHTRLARLGGWDEHVLAACLDLLHDGAVFHDIGASVGYFTIEVAACFGDRVSIVAVEPQPGPVGALTRSVTVNGYRNVRVLPLLLSDEQGEGRLHVPSRSVHASLVPRARPRAVVSRAMTTLDALVADGRTPAPDVIKIDVEGAELAVLRGARAVLTRHHPAVIFESDANAHRFGYGRADLLAFLRDCGYTSFFHLHPDGPRAADPVAGDEAAQDMAALVPERMTARFRAALSAENTGGRKDRP